MFVNFFYYVVVKVDIEVGYVICYVIVVDRDSGRNGEVYYYFKEYYEYF